MKEKTFSIAQVALNHYFNINDKMNLISSALGLVAWAVPVRTEV